MPLARTVFAQWADGTPERGRPFDRASGVGARACWAVAAHHGRTALDVSRALDGAHGTALRAVDRERRVYRDTVPTPRQESAEGVSQANVRTPGRIDARPVAGAPMPAPRPTGARPVGAGVKTPGGLIDAGRTERSPDGLGLGRGRPAAGSVTKRDGARARQRAIDVQARAVALVGARALDCGTLERAYAAAPTARERRAIRSVLRAARHRAHGVTIG